MPVITAELVFLIGIVLIFILLMKRLAVHGRDNGRLNDNEAEIMQNIYKGLSRLEDRVEALETLLMDTATSPQKKPSGNRDKEGDTV